PDAVRDRLDRRQRIVDLMREHTDDALPRLLLLFAQRAAQIGEHQQLVRPAVAPERRAPQLDATALRSEGSIDQLARVSGEIRREPEFGRAATDEPGGGRANQ